MRVFLFILFIFTGCSSCIAQDKVYSPFVEEGKTWYMKYSNEEAPEFSDYDYRYYMKGDTLIGGIECKKFYVFNYNNTQETEYLLAIFENDRKVYFIPKEREESYVLYDFGPTRGAVVSVTDAIHTDWKKNLTMIEEKNINSGLESRRCFLIQPVREEDPTEIFSGWWIDGIGSELGPLSTWLFGAVGNYSYFIKCEVNGKEIIDMEDFKSLSSSVLPVCHKEKSPSSNIFSISGVKMKNGHGVFIQDKKKIFKWRN